jgi:hypothetical protein
MSDTNGETDPINVIYQSECLSVSGRSTLEFAVGRHGEDGSLHMAIVSNSGGGMWCKEWASAQSIQDVVIGATELTSVSFHALHPGKSINTGGFFLAALKELGLIRANAENSRQHEHVPAATFEQVFLSHMERAKSAGTKPARKKGKEG